jgi:DNA-binding LytR/AlgR family response regulator
MTSADVLDDWRRYIPVTLALGLLAALIGPFGTYADMGWAARLVYWLGIFLVNGVQVVAALALVAAVSRGRLPSWAVGVVAALLASVPATLEVAALEYWLRDHDMTPYLHALFAEVLLLTVAVTVSMVLIRSRLKHHAPIAVPGVPVPEGPRGETLLKRVKPEARGELLALQMEDHYLRVHTSAGNDLILLRLSDALPEVAGLDGMQVHRSYWVARAAVRGVEKDGRKLALVLTNGMKVPVSRANVTAIRAAGWV